MYNKLKIRKHIGGSSVGSNYHCCPQHFLFLKCSFNFYHPLEKPSLATFFFLSFCSFTLFSRSLLSLIFLLSSHHILSNFCFLFSEFFPLLLLEHSHFSLYQFYLLHSSLYLQFKRLYSVHVRCFDITVSLQIHQYLLHFQIHIIPHCLFSLLNASLATKILVTVVILTLLLSFLIFVLYHLTSSYLHCIFF